MTFFFRTDASNEIGTGHIMRCLTLACRLRELGANCVFICRVLDGNQLHRVRDAGFRFIALPRSEMSNSAKVFENTLTTHSNWLTVSWQDDAQQTVKCLTNEVVDWLIVDHYALDRKWEKCLRSYAKKIMVIDDIADRNHDCDLLLDQNMVLNLERRYEGLVPPQCRCLLGPRYALIQPEYSKLRPYLQPRQRPVRRILVYFGGVDLFDLTGITISAILALQRKGIKVDVVISSQSPNSEAVREKVKGNDGISCYEYLSSLAPLMLQADMAIGAGGATTWERLCMGLPSLVVSTGENQIGTCEELARIGLITYLGRNNDLSFERLLLALRSFLKNTGKPQQSLVNGKTLVDGRGAERVAKILVSNKFQPKVEIFKEGI
jgi:UDP-2,4-diacetamido-2,4,6-trideoxy-beta-L-altropyranose hydrolase